MPRITAAALFTVLVLSLPPGYAGETAEDPVQASFDRLVDALRDTQAAIRQMPAYGSEAERVGGQRHVLRAFIKGLEAEVLQDADYPYFRILDFWLKEGGDNPDQRYAFSPVRGGEPYRVWGTLGSATRVEIQLYAGRPWDGSGKSVGYLNAEDIAVAPDGSFEVWVSAEQRPGTWLANPEDATTLFVRHIYADWNQARPGEVHIDRVGFEGARRPQETAQELAARLDAAATMFRTTALNWPTFVQKRYIDARPANTVIPPIDTYRMGGAKGRWLSSGHFDLAEDEALLIRMPATDAAYQGIQLTDLWYASLEHGNQISSLTTQQSAGAPDDAFYYVVSSTDPRYPNWLDTGALSRGTMILRWDGMTKPLTEAEWPSARVLKKGEVAAAIPGFYAVDETSRINTRAERRRHLQLRANR